MSKLLKDRRESLGKDLKEISILTRLRSGYLQAIEEEDFKKLPAEVYTRGYIREYARILGVPYEAAICPYERYLEQTKGPKEKLKETSCEEEAAPSISTPKREALTSAPRNGSSAHYQKKASIVPKLAAAGIGIIVISALYLFVTQHQDSPIPALPVSPAPSQNEPVEQDAAPAAAQPAQEPQMAQPLQTASAPSTVPESKPAETPQPAAPAPQSGKHTLEIAAAETVWLRVVLDNAVTKDVTLQPGEKITYEAKETLALKIGNAGGVRLKIDGKEMGKLGESGQVVDLTLPSQGAQPEPLKKSASGAPSSSNLSRSQVPSAP